MNEKFNLAIHDPFLEVGYKMRALCISIENTNHYKWLSNAPIRPCNRWSVQVKVAGSSMNHMDLFAPQIPPYRMLRNGKPGGFDFSGRIVEVGESVRHFSPGDRVFGFAPGFCEYTNAYPWLISRVPDAIQDLSAMSLYPSVAGTALQIIRKHMLRRGRSVSRLAVIGASGGIGSSVIQLARHYGGPNLHITAVASARNADYCASLGADQFIDYKKHIDWSTAFAPHALDLIVDTVSGNVGFPDYVPHAFPLRSTDGMYVCTNSLNPQDYLRKFSGTQRKGFDLFVMNPFQVASSELPEISRLVETGALKLRAGNQISFDEDSMLRALQHFKERHAQGKTHIHIG